MISIKSNREIELMREAGHILAQTREMLVPHMKPGVTTSELDLLADEFIRSKGATPSFKDYNGYPKSICTSINEVIIHGIPSPKAILKNGDILSLDLGVNYKGYHADSAWTYPIGEIKTELKQLLDVAEKSLWAGLQMVKPGNTVNDISSAIENYIKPYGYGIVEDFTGHGIGQNLHEDPPIPNYGREKINVILRPGMTMCIEPMVNLGTKRVRVLSDNWTTITQDKKPSAHFEHTIVVTSDGYDILSKVKE